MITVNLPRFPALLISVILPLCSDLNAQRVGSIALAAPNAVLDRDAERFTEIISIAELPNGNLLVSDRRENRLAFIDWSSRSISNVSRLGDGPGEYRAVGRLYAFGDSTLMTDFQNWRWYLLHGPRVATTLDARQPLNRILGPSLSGADRHGHVLGVSGFVYSTRIPIESANADSLLVLIADRSSARIDTVARIRGRGPNGVGTSTRGRGRSVSIEANPLVSEDQALLFIDGWVALAYTEPYRVDWRRPDGSWIRGAPLPFIGRSVDTREKCAALNRSQSRPASNCDHAAVPNWPKTLPPFLPLASDGISAPNSQTLFAAPGGHLLIRRTPSDALNDNRYDLVNRLGLLEGTLQLPVNEAVIGFGAHSIYVVRTEDDGLQTIRRHAWRTPAER